jgi:hypothetical protein
VSHFIENVSLEYSCYDSNGEFEMATASENNSFVQDGFLYISPTLTSDNIGEAAVVDGTVYNITGCTFNTTEGLSYTTSTTQAVNSSQTFNIAQYNKACSAISNSTSGKIINPVQSARLSTRYSASIRYGRVDVRAKLPTGYVESFIDLHEADTS